MARPLVLAVAALVAAASPAIAGNVTIVHQDGDSNRVEQIQHGAHNRAEAHQSGEDNLLRQIQSGHDNRAEAWQTESIANRAVQVQTGIHARSEIVQMGERNSGLIIQR